MNWLRLFPPESESGGEASAPDEPGPLTKIDWTGFNRAILWSAFFHLIVFVLFSFTTIIRLPSAPPSSLASIEKSGANDLELFSAALQELTRDKDWQEKLSRVLPTLEDNRLPELPEQFRLLEDKIPDREKVEIFKKLLEVYLTASTSNEPGSASAPTGASSFLSGENNFQVKSGERVFLRPSAGQKGQVELYVLEAKASHELEALQKADSLRSAPALIGPGQSVRLNLSGHYAEVPAEYYYRRSPFEEILARGSYLFSIVRGFPKVSSGKASEEEIKKPPLPQIFPQGEFQVIYYGQVEIPLARTETCPKDDRPPLDLKPEEWNKKLDALMVDPEEIQFARFEKDYLQKYSWQDARLAQFTRNFINSNLNGVFLVEDEFTSAFDSLEELFYKKTIFERMAALVEKQPPSPVRDELMFCLASSLDLERRVITHLEKAYPQASEICLRKYPLPHVHYSLSKAYVLKKMYEELLAEIKRLGFYSWDEVEKKYLEKELAIYQVLAERGGQTRARALYAIGLTYWEEGQADQAIKTWQQIEEKGCPDYVSSLLKVIREAPSATIYTYIDNELNYQTAKNTKYLYRRQQQFHKWARRRF